MNDTEGNKLIMQTRGQIRQGMNNIDITFGLDWYTDKGWISRDPFKKAMFEIGINQIL